MNDKKKLVDFKDVILKEEKASLSNIVKVDDKQIIAKIIRLYEEMKKNDNK